MTKEELKKIVREAAEDVWYNKRSWDPVKEQTELITEAVYKALYGHECKVCGKSFDSPEDLYIHYDEEHN